MRKGRVLPMRRFVDLHVHSSASDGQLAPAEVVRLAEGERLAAVALTDHDTVAGLWEAAAEAGQFPKLRFVPGVEVSARFSPGTLHILGLNIDPASRALRRLTEQLVSARRERNPRIIARLQALGLDVEMQDVLAEAGTGHGGPGGIVGRLHIARALMRKGYVAGVSEAFEKYIGGGAPAYFDKERLTPAEVIAAIHDAGGLAVLAHPVQLACEDRTGLERAVRDLTGAGLDGIEVYHSDHSPQQTRSYLDLALRLDLGVTGGSDFHGAAKPGVMLGRPLVPLAAINESFARALFRNHPSDRPKGG